MRSPHANTLCVVGAGPHIVEHIDTVLEKERARLDADWHMASHANADLLIIDTESVYGYMDWLRTATNRRLAVAYTDAPDTVSSEFVLRKPIVANELIAILNRIGARLHKADEAGGAVAATSLLGRSIAGMPAATAAMLRPALTDLLDTDASLTQCLQLAAPGLPTVLLDPQRRSWYSAASLKNLAGWCQGAIAADAMHMLDANPFAAAVGNLPAYPYARLLWLAHLLGHDGVLAPNLDGRARYRLARWPQSERDFPRHFRIATVLLKQAATPEDIAARSGAPRADVHDFINAYHAIGYIEHDGAQTRADEARRGGLFSRIRKTSAN